MSLAFEAFREDLDPEEYEQFVRTVMEQEEGMLVEAIKRYLKEDIMNNPNDTTLGNLIRKKYG